MIKPRKLRPGDKVATVSLSWGGPGAIPHRYEAGKKQLQDEFGLIVVEMPHTLKEPDWLHRNPQARAEDLMAAFSDTTVAGIVSTIGGDDSIRLLPFLDLDVIRSNPKVFMGIPTRRLPTWRASRPAWSRSTGQPSWPALPRTGDCFLMASRPRSTVLLSDLPLSKTQ